MVEENKRQGGTNSCIFCLPFMSGLHLQLNTIHHPDYHLAALLTKSVFCFLWYLLRNCYSWDCLAIAIRHYWSPGAIRVLRAAVRKSDCYRWSQVLAYSTRQRRYNIILLSVSWSIMLMADQTTCSMWQVPFKQAKHTVALCFNLGEI